jgi:glycosyltransferase involved in cell wall biosynthesis
MAICSQMKSADRLQVVHLTGSIHPAQGGPAYSVPRLCGALGEAGVETRLLTLKDPRQGLITAVREEFPMRGPAKLGFAPDMWRRLASLAAAGEVDITHSHNLWQMPQIYPDWLVRQGIPHVVSPRGTLTAYSMAAGSRLKVIHWPLVQRPVLKRAAAFHATGDSEAEDIRRLGFRQPIALLPVGIDLPEWEPPSETDARTILFLGRLHPEKGPMRLIEAWGLIQHQLPDWRVRLIGPDPIGHKRELEQRLKDSAIERVEFGPEVRGPEKLQALRQGSLLVLPSPTENFGVVVAEALSVGIPVIANHGAPWRTLAERGAGWWIPHGPEPLAETMLKAARLPYAKRRAMGEAGRDLAAAELGWSSIGRRMAEVYSWLLRGGSRPDCVHGD